MPLQAGDFALASRLLDEAMDLSPADAQAWLDALPPEHAHLRDSLRKMLASRRSATQGQFLESGPCLEGHAPMTDSTVAVAGDRVGPYRLIRELGHGGMGTVWLADRADGAYQRQLALKLPRLTWGSGLVERMARERDIGALLEHPHIARLYDAGVDDQGRPYLALEFIDGQPIDAWSVAQSLDIRARLRLFVQVARAVAYAHGRLIVHRDLKPSNVLVTEDGQAHLLDFGIAKLLTEALAEGPGLTQQQGRVLTPHYASPEQVAGEAITVQSDVYSLGVLLYELLTGTLPTKARRSTLGALEDAILESDVPPASTRVKHKAAARALRGEVDAILSKALQREAAKRYATADAMALDIERHLAGETVSAKPDSTAYRLSKVMRRHWVGIGTATAIVVALVAGGGVAWWQARELAQEAERRRIATQFVSEMFRVTAQSSLRRREVADAGVGPAAKLIATRFLGQPDVQASLYGAVGRVYTDIGAGQLGARFARLQLAALEQTNAGPEFRVRALLLLAEADVRAQRFAEAEAVLREATRLLGPDVALGFEVRARLADVLVDVEGKAPESARIVDGLTKSRWADPAIPTMGGAQLLELKSLMLLRVDRLDEARPLYEAAIRMALDVEGPASYWANEQRLTYAGYLTLRGRHAEAFALYDAAMLALAGAGDAGRIQAATLAAPFWARVLQYRARPPAEVLRALEANRATLQEFGPAIPAEVAAQMDLYLGRADIFLGRVTEAYRLIGTSAPVMLAFTDSPLERILILGSLARAEMAIGRHAEADAHIRELMRTRDLTGTAKAPGAASDWVRLAKNLVMQGRAADAERELRLAPDFPEMRSAGQRGKAYAYAVRVARAQALLEQGDVKAALALLPEKDDVPLTSVNSHAPLRGEMFCASRREQEGLALTADWIDANAPLVAQEDPELARVKSTAGLCALKLGDRKRAKAWAAQARQAFQRQPEVSDWYKAPLKRLEGELAGRSGKW